jgi:D-alanine-D-alanine ligase
MTQKGSLRVGVLFGGRSGEHEVSLNSARNVIDALNKAGHTVIPIGISPQGRWLTNSQALGQLGDGGMNGYQTAAIIDHEPQADDPWALLPQATEDAPLPLIDVIFPVLHGPYGEDGTVQGLLEMANVPYVGSGVLASAVGMDKAVAKQLFAHAGLRQAAFRVVMRKAWQTAPKAVLAGIEAELPYPLFVKPANLGSSIGVSKVRDRGELAEAIALAARFDRKVLVEEAVPNAREIEVSVLGNEEPLVSIPGEIVPGNEFYDYAAKYLDDNSQLLIPAPIDQALVEEVQATALMAFRVADCSGLARVDFLLDDASGRLYLNEINTMPGFTRISMYPKLWEASGLSYPELVDRLIDLALERHADRLQNATTRHVQE